MQYDNLLELVKKRRSIRRFKPDPIPDDYIDKIIEVARQAPSGFNTQPWEFVIINDTALRDKIVELFPPPGEMDAPNDFRIAPVYIIQLGDPRTKAGLPEFIVGDESKTDPVFISSLASSFLYLNLAATSLGLTGQWISVAGSPPVQAGIKKLIGIPDLYKLYDVLAIGYPAAEPSPKLLRDAADMVHYNYCKVDEFRTDEEAAALAKETQNWAKEQHKR